MNIGNLLSAARDVIDYTGPLAQQIPSALNATRNYYANFNSSLYIRTIYEDAIVPFSQALAGTELGANICGKVKALFTSEEGAYVVNLVRHGYRMHGDWMTVDLLATGLNAYFIYYCMRRSQKASTAKRGAIWLGLSAAASVALVCNVANTWLKISADGREFKFSWALRETCRQKPNIVNIRKAPHYVHLEPALCNAFNFCRTYEKLNITVPQFDGFTSVNCLSNRPTSHHILGPANFSMPIGDMPKVFFKGMSDVLKKLK